MTRTNVLPLFISVSIMIPDIRESVSYVINLGVRIAVFSIYSFVLLPWYLGNISCFTVNTVLLIPCVVSNGWSVFLQYLSAQAMYPITLEAIYFSPVPFFYMFCCDE